MTVTKKGIDVGSKVLYDIQFIFSRVIELQASAREVDFKDVLSYELAPIPTTLFDDQARPKNYAQAVYVHTLTSIIIIGEMQICKSKADLKKNTRVEISMRNNCDSCQP